MNLTEEQWAEIQRRQGAKPASLPTAPAVKLPKPRMNGTETLYSVELEARRRAGELLWWGFESVKLKMAEKTAYTPDFTVWFEHGMEFHETKGHERDDAIVKFKTASAMFPWAGFVMLKRSGGGFEITRRMRGGVSV